VKRRILVPRGHQPVRGQRGGKGAADDESEVARTRCRHKARFGTCSKCIDDSVGVLAALWQRAAERVTHACGVDAGGHRTLVDAVEELPCVPRGGGQAGGSIAHGKTLSASGFTARTGLR
jgi:hypothetical protein